MDERADFPNLGNRFLLRSEQTGGRFSLLEHDLAPRALGSPVHTHEHEDEYSLVTAGRIGVLIGAEVSEAGPGEWVVKPRGIPHAFWNAGDEEARFFEIISPAGFEDYFEQLAPLLPPQRTEPDVPGIVATAARFGLTIDPGSIGPLAERFGLRV